MTKEYLDKKFPEKIKEFHKYDQAYFLSIFDHASLSITKNMHPIIAYNYPDLLHKFFDDKDLSNIDRSPSIILHYNNRNMFSGRIDQESIDMCKVIKRINNKEFTEEEVLQLMDDINASKRLRATFSKSYPLLHDKFTNPKDNFKYNMMLIALEHKHWDYVEHNIQYALSKFKDRLKEEWSGVFKYLNGDYTDDELLNHINDFSLAELAHDESTAIKFITHHNTTVGYTIRTQAVLHTVQKLGLDLSSISTDLLEANRTFVLQHWPYFFSEMETRNDDNEAKLALKDPYNVRYIKLNSRLIKDFLNCSNINIQDAYLGLTKGEHYKHNRNIILGEISKFQGVFLALQTYPIIIMLLSEQEYYKHVTPYLINHTCKIDPSMFTFFERMENKRWNNP